MTRELERLALQVQLPAFAGVTLPGEYSALFEEGLGGLCLFGSNTAAGPSGVAALTAAVHDLSPDAVVAVDEEGGDVTRLHARTGSPVLGHAGLGAADDLALTTRTASAIGTELATLGVTLDLGPVADVNSNPDNPVIGVRSFGADSELVARHVAAWVDGLQSAGVAACAKHFPGHGDTHEDSHLALPRVEATRQTLGSRELVPFAAAVEAGVAAVMTSHLVVPAIDERPATFSEPVLRLLRDDLGFDGAVVSDALDMAGASAGRGIPAAAVAALGAGVDLLCLGADKDPALVRSVQAAIVAAVRSGSLSEERLRSASARTRRLARRTPPRPGQDADDGWQLAGARSALTVEGELPTLAHAFVVRVETAPSIAVGEVPWGLESRRVVDPHDPEAFDALLGASEGRPIVLQVRDAHRHPEVTALLGKVTGGMVVEWGWPGPWTSDLPRVCSYGASLPAKEAVAELLRERGWTA